MVRFITSILSAGGLRRFAAGVLIFAGVASVALAASGAELALDLMKYHFSLGMLAALALFMLLALPVALRGNWWHGLIGKWPVHALHLGLALALVGWMVGLVGSPAEGSLTLRSGQLGAVGDSFIFALDDFSIDYWPDTGTVRRYASKGRVGDDVSDQQAETLQAGGGRRVVIEVNHPLVKDGWWVYQNSYQETTNPHNGKPLYFTVLLCVKDNGLWLAVLGGVFLILGALGYAVMVFRGDGRSAEIADARPDAACPKLAKVAWVLYGGVFLLTVAMLVNRGLSTGHPPMQNMYEFLMCSAAFIPMLTLLARRERHAMLVDAALQTLVLMPVAFFMDGRVKHLMPALQSPFFVPHVGAYVLGYLLLVRAAFGVGRRLVGVGFWLLTLGLVLGAAWGKVCWGHWWQFDPKEMWSLATWFTYAAYFHLRAGLSPRSERAFLVAGAVMIVLTLTWINLSRMFTGMHSYA